MLTLAMCNQKGGVGKSTSTFHLARAAVEAGMRVLVIDSDPQGNLTGVVVAADVVDETEFKTYAGLADLLHEDSDVPVAEVLLPGVWAGLTVLPTPNAKTLARVRSQLVTGRTGKEKRLAEALDAVRGDYDLCLIDCPPSLDLLTINALAAADGVAIVLEAGKWATDGMGELLDSVADVRKYFNSDLRVAGVQVNGYDSRTLRAEHWLTVINDVATERGLAVLPGPVPHRVVIADTTEASYALRDWTDGDRSTNHKLADLYADHLKTLIANLNGAH
jgi:chromosome partitioning protein